ncbi:uncharacterized protein TNCV_3421821 [Trichonephila clavipes]|nr:uncharacterized protein TNCV_3421821 [Trichonephila clavipes]
MQYQCILGIDFRKESKLTLDFDKKPFIIPDDQIKQLPKVEKQVEIDLSDTKLGGGQKQKLKDLSNGFKGLFSDQPGLTHVLYHEIETGDQGPVLTRVDSCCFKSKFYRKDLIDELKIFGMSSRHHIDDFMRGRIIGKIKEGRKITDVAREFDIAHSVVSRLWKSFKTTGMCSRRHGGGRVRSTTPAEDRYIVLSAKRNRRTTAQQVANQFLAASGK